MIYLINAERILKDRPLRQLFCRYRPLAIHQAPREYHHKYRNNLNSLIGNYV